MFPALFNLLSYDNRAVSEEQGTWNLRQVGPVNCLTEQLQCALAALRNWEEKVQFISFLDSYAKVSIARRKKTRLKS